MNPLKFQKNNSRYFIIPVILVYIILTMMTINNCYFWDNVQQISKEAHWYYLTNFNSLLMPAQNSGSEIVATGYHPPLMGIMTAALWKVFGYKLWVSHVFSFFWVIILMYNVWKILSSLFTDKIVGWVFLVVMLEPTVLSQFSVASPDLILFTAFVISLRAMLERKPLMLSIGLFFLCCINMRGIFIGAIIFVVHNYYTYLQLSNRFNIRAFYKTLLPYLPTFILLIAYFVYYFYARGWFFSNSVYSEHYKLPTGFGKVIRHLAEFGLRSVENGRIAIWLIGVFVAVITVKSKKISSKSEKSLILFFLLLTGLYLLFVFITQMPFSARYFMPQFFLLTILTMLGVTEFLKNRRITLVFILVLCFELTGNLWIYPDKVAKSWDCTLAHLPYYELRNDCFNYIDAKNINYKDISAGFSFSGNRRFSELTNSKETIGYESNRDYYIFSNISNVEDSFAEELKNPAHWKPIKRFEKGMVYITIYKQIFSNNKEP